MKSFIGEQKDFVMDTITNRMLMQLEKNCYMFPNLSYMIVPPQYYFRRFERLTVVIAYRL